MSACPEQDQPTPNTKGRNARRRKVREALANAGRKEEGEETKVERKAYTDAEVKSISEKLNQGLTELDKQVKSLIQITSPVVANLRSISKSNPDVQVFMSLLTPFEMEMVILHMRLQKTEKLRDQRYHAWAFASLYEQLKDDPPEVREAKILGMKFLRQMTERS